MNPDDDLAESLTFVAVILDSLVAEWRRFNRPMPPTVSRARSLLAKSLARVRQLESQACQDDTREYIGTRELAELQGISLRSAQRHAEANGGKLIGGRYVLDAQTLKD
jgi:hypothetical protein